MEKGYMVFTVTTANGSVPIKNARVVLTANEKTKESITKSDGRSFDIEFEFTENDPPFFIGTVKITAPGYLTAVLEKVYIYKNVTTVRIVNLDKNKLT